MVPDQRLRKQRYGATEEKGLRKNALSQACQIRINMRATPRCFLRQKTVSRPQFEKFQKKFPFKTLSSINMCILKRIS
jgi:hypothetical protein